MTDEPKTKSGIPLDKIQALLADAGFRAELQSFLNGVDAEKTTKGERNQKWDNSITVAEMDNFFKSKPGIPAELKDKFYTSVNEATKKGALEYNLDASNFDIRKPETYTKDSKGNAHRSRKTLGTAQDLGIEANATILSDAQIDTILESTFAAAAGNDKLITKEGLVQTGAFTAEQADFLFTAAKTAGVVKEIAIVEKKIDIVKDYDALIAANPALTPMLIAAKLKAEAEIKNETKDGLPKTLIASTDPVQAMVMLMQQQEKTRAEREDKEREDKKVEARRKQLEDEETKKTELAKKAEEEKKANSAEGILSDLLSGNLLGAIVKICKKIKNGASGLLAEMKELFAPVANLFSSGKQDAVADAAKTSQKTSSVDPSVNAVPLDVKAPNVPKLNQNTDRHI